MTCGNLYPGGPDEIRACVLPRGHTEKHVYHRDDEATLELNEHLVVLRERRDWLTERIKAKVSVGWDVVWDEREQRALAWAVRQLEEAA